MSANRRDFLKLMGAVGVGNLLGTESADASAPERSSDDWLGMLTDLTLCIGCRKCEWACNDVNGLPNRPLEVFDDQSVFERQRRTDAEHFTVVNRHIPGEPGAKPVYVKVQCMHCNEPACASACLVAAFRKTRTGQVVYNENVCIGCRYCMVACPFSIPAYTYDKAFAPVVRKCTMCFDKVAERHEVPACAKICPVEAITFGKRRDLLALARERMQHESARYVNHIYGEHEVGGTCWMYIAGRPFEQLGFRTTLGTTPAPDLTSTFLSAVPLVLTLWPALLMGAYAFTRHRDELAQTGEAENAPTTREEG